MGLFRNAMNLFRGKAGRGREEEAAGLPTAQAGRDREEDAAAGLPTAQAGRDREEDAAAGLLTAEAEVVKAQPVVASREVKREARPDPNKPGWGLTFGQEIGKARGDRASQE